MGCGATSAARIMQDFIASLVSLLLIEPLESRLAEKLQGARAPQAVVTEVVTCARNAAPIVAGRITGDPWWGVQTLVRVWIGTSSPDAVLVEVAPRCRSAVDAARPFLTGREA